MPHNRLVYGVIFQSLKRTEAYFSLTKLMESHDLPRSTVTSPIEFDHKDLPLTSEFDRALDLHCQALVYNLETSNTITCT